MGYVKDMSYCDWKEVEITINGEIKFETGCGESINISKTTSAHPFTYCPFCARYMRVFRLAYRQRKETT